MTFAADTSVPIDRSQAELQKILRNYKASSFAFGETQIKATIVFEMINRRIRFTLPLPIRSKFRTEKQYEQACRTQWRCLVLAIKAKLQSVESGISTLEEEFLANIVLPGNQTVGQAMIPQLEIAYKTNRMPPMLGYDG